MRANELAALLSLAQRISLCSGCRLSNVVLATINLCHNQVAAAMPVYVNILSVACRELYVSNLDQQVNDRPARMQVAEVVSASQALMERRAESKKQLKTRPVRAIAKHLLYLLADICRIAVHSPAAALDLRTKWRRTISEIFRHCTSYDKSFLFATLDNRSRAIAREVLEELDL